MRLSKHARHMNQDFSTRPFKWSMRLAWAAIATLPLLGACDDDDNDSYAVQLTGDSTMLSNDAKAKVVLYGYNSTYVDQFSTVIDTQIVNLGSLPAEYDLPWPGNAESLIQDPPVTGEGQARFYLAVTVDADGDGLLCQGDLIRDNDQTPTSQFTERPRGTTTIALKAQEADFCREFSVSVPVIL